MRTSLLPNNAENTREKKMPILSTDANCPLPKRVHRIAILPTLWISLFTLLRRSSAFNTAGAQNSQLASERHSQVVSGEYSTRAR
jgi:hypothetical protein